MAFMETDEFTIANVGGGSFQIVPMTPAAREKMANYCIKTWNEEANDQMADDGSVQWDEDPFGLVDAWDALTESQDHS